MSKEFGKDREKRSEDNIQRESKIPKTHKTGKIKLKWAPNSTENQWEQHEKYTKMDEMQNERHKHLTRENGRMS